MDTNTTPMYPLGYIPERHDVMGPYDAAMDIADAMYWADDEADVDLRVHNLIREIKVARGTAQN